MWKVLARVLLVGSLILAVGQWMWWYSTLAEALEPLGLGFAEWLGLGDPVVEQATTSRLWDLADPRAVFRVYGGGRLLLLLFVTAVVVAVWIKADLQSEALGGRILFAGLITLPAIVGLGVMAGPGARRSVHALREAGLTNPSLVGAGVADVYGMALMGAALGVVLALVYLGLLRRADHQN